VHGVVAHARAAEESLEGAPFGRRQRLDPGPPVDEQPVPPVGGHPPGAGVRLADVALLLQHRHVVAYGRRRHVEVVPLDERLAADRLLSGDVVLDDGAQHRQLAVVEGHGSPPSRSVKVTRRAGWHSAVWSASLRPLTGVRDDHLSEPEAARDICRLSRILIEVCRPDCPGKVSVVSWRAVVRSLTVAPMTETPPPPPGAAPGQPEQGPPS